MGIDSFQKIRENDFYYVDKTQLIEQLLYNWGEVNLFTRSRRFGKTLNMSMLRYFFEIGTDETLFDGLSIISRKDLCEEHMGKYPMIFLSLKGVDGLKYLGRCYILLFEVKRFAGTIHFHGTENKRSLKIFFVFYVSVQKDSWLQLLSV